MFFDDLINYLAADPATAGSAREGERLRRAAEANSLLAIALVSDDGLPADPARPFEQLAAHLALAALGRGESEGAWSAVGREEAVRPNPQKKRECEAQ